MKRIQLVTKHDPNFEGAIQLIETSYRQAFEATVRVAPTQVLTLTEQTDSGLVLLACLTLTSGEGRSFFSEQYLDRPVEDALLPLAGNGVDRNQIVEVGGLASARPSAGKELMSHAPWLVLGLGYRFALITATEQVRYLVAKIGMDFHTIAAASRERLQEDQRAGWGQYYANNPVTGVIDVLVEEWRINQN